MAQERGRSKQIWPNFRFRLPRPKPVSVINKATPATPDKPLIWSVEYMVRQTDEIPVHRGAVDNNGPTDARTLE